MNKIYSNEMISREIENLFNQVEEFLLRKDVFVECVRYSYLHASTNN